MTPLNKVLKELAARLPELEWKLGELTLPVKAHDLPKHVFQLRHELTPQTCVEEIKADIDYLAKQTSHRGAEYLATRIKQKINVLVTLCHLDKRQQKPEKKTDFGLDRLSTRQQWISALEKNIDTLILQQQALIKTLHSTKVDTAPEVILSLKSELGEVERRLTLAQETLNQVIS